MGDAAAQQHKESHKESQKQNQKQIDALVIDSGPLIRGHLLPLARRAAAFFTVPEVLLELRDRETRGAIAVLPFDLVERSPSTDAVAAVVAFAKKTGDYASLSSVDIKVLALTYMLEKERNGTANIRTQPVSALTAVGGKRLQTQSINKNASAENAPADELASSSSTLAGISDGHVDSADTQRIQETSVADDDNQAAAAPIDGTDGTLDQQQQHEVGTHQEHELLEKEDDDRSIDQHSDDHSDAADDHPDVTNDAVELVPDHDQLQDGDNDNLNQENNNNDDNDEDDDDDGGWITPKNVARHKARDMHGNANRKSAAISAPTVACTTTDFAMQNVLLQMNLGVVSVDGMVVRTLKSWILRCHGCYKLTQDMSRQFCPSCGNNTLMRTSYSVDANTGRVTVYLKRNFQYNLRGTKYSIPTPKGGRNAGNLVLREDQKEFVSAVKTQKHMEKKLMAANPLDVDTSLFNESRGRRAVGGGGTAGVVVGHGRRNVNEARRGRRRK